MSALRQWRRAFAHGAQWRYLILFLLAMILAAALALGPIATFLASLFDHSPQFEALVSRLDSPAFVEVLRQLREPAGAPVMPGVHDAFHTALLLSPALAGAAVVLARKSGPSDVRTLLAGAGELYPRMLRMALAGLIPFGIAAGIAAGAFHLAGKAGDDAILESTASHATELATAITVLFVWLADAIVEAGRAHLAAEPERRSAIVALWSGVRLTVRRPGRVLGLCFVTTIAGLGLALILSAIRFRIVQAGAGSIGVAFVLGQLAVAAIAWGRLSRLSGLVSLIRDENQVG
jgi:hypothetical protein